MTGDTDAPPMVDPGRFRSAMGQLANGVTVVTTCAGRIDYGMTATAVMSVSLEPALVVVAVGTASVMYDVLVDQELWAINVLGRQHRLVAARFAASGRPGAAHLLDGVPHHRGAATGAILFEESLASLECHTEQLVPVGDHHLFVGRVLGVEEGAGAGPLVHFRGGYCDLA
ncbi:MAG: flavin reductase family protein [Mycobacteriales bacterium]